MEALEAIRRRRMHRALLDEPLEDAAVAAILDAALAAPTAGYTQAVELLVAQEATSRASILDAITTPAWRRAHPRFLRLYYAPLVVAVAVDPAAYLARYAEQDKLDRGLAHEDAWPVPYWWVDAGCAVEGLLIAVSALGLGARLLGVFRGEDQLRSLAGATATTRFVAVVVIGRPAAEAPAGSAATRARRPARARLHPLDLSAQRTSELVGKLRDTRPGGNRGWLP